MIPQLVSLARVSRGTELDAEHMGAVAVVDRSGELIASAGDPDYVVATRSTLKPLQALPLVAAGGIERFGFSPQQVALLCASHSGEPRHREGVADMLRRAGCTPDDLQCGLAQPTDERGEPVADANPSALAHNCSGKHAGMLAWCRQADAPVASYLDLEHPLQRAIRQAVARFCGVAEGAMPTGVDGCSAPNYAVPLRALAHAYAKLAGGRPDSGFGTAAGRLAQAMTAHPEMVSGAGRSDLALAIAGHGGWIAKGGAEGIQAIGLRDPGWGVAIKVADGQRRALMPAVVAVLDALGLVDAQQRARLGDWVKPPVKNDRGLVTGHIEATVVLDKQPRRLR